MNYRHAFHAGNFADVVKHVALVAVILHLKRKEKPFCVIDTHAGRGLYDLESAEALRTEEAAEGVGRLSDLSRETNLPEALRCYIESVEAEGTSRYPGSARIAARQLRTGDRLVAIEMHPQDASALGEALRIFPAAQVIEGDGYVRLPQLLPPRERRGVVLIDPPYEAENEFARAVDALAAAHQRFPTGCYLLWYPIKSRGAAEALCGEVATRGLSRAVRLEVDTDGPAENRLSAAGLVVVNPPYGFETEMAQAAAVLAPRLGRNADHPAKISLATL